MKRALRLATISVVTLTAACSSYKLCLEEQLTGKSDDEKRIILAQECQKEIAAGLKPDEPANVRHFQRLRVICEELTGKTVKLPKQRSGHADS